MIGTVKGHEIKKNQDGDKNVVLLQVELSDEKDVQTVQLYSMSGEISIPQAGAKVVILPDPDSAWKKGIAIDDLIEHTGITAGEKKLYSYDSGTIKAFINFLKSGIIEINGNNDFAVRFDALDTAIQTFITTLNALFATKLDASGQTPGTLTLDISAAKVEEVKII